MTTVAAEFFFAEQQNCSAAPCQFNKAIINKRQTKKNLNEPGVFYVNGLCYRVNIQLKDLFFSPVSFGTERRMVSAQFAVVQ